MNGATAQRKRHDFERWVVNALNTLFGDGTPHGLARREDDEAEDPIAPAFFVACKRGRRTHARAALRQAQEASKGRGLWPIAITKDDGDPPIVTIAFEDFRNLLKVWRAGRQGERASQDDARSGARVVARAAVEPTAGEEQ